MARRKVTYVATVVEEQLRPRRTEMAVSVSIAVQNMMSTHNEVVPLCCVKLSVEMLLKINLYELTASFERCIFETERIETRGN